MPKLLKMSYLERCPDGNYDGYFGEGRLILIPVRTNPVQGIIGFDLYFGPKGEELEEGEGNDEEKGIYTVSGRIVDELLKPVEATVELNLVGRKTTEEKERGFLRKANTDHEGWYFFDGLAPGEYVLGVWFGKNRHRYIKTGKVSVEDGNVKKHFQLDLRE